ncbi:hypothetical protein EDB89DRAFT_1961336 [Lactarius sanguifluus]|nr:hypothetical protein EDB89DRAFT_2046307 [Lactarius sanguifluus]KAH9173108.1 hypothetical protein EDB89DRAFT_1961336 [Lactarius sanguifluus]
MTRIRLALLSSPRHPGKLTRSSTALPLLFLTLFHPYRPHRPASSSSTVTHIVCAAFVRVIAIIYILSRRRTTPCDRITSHFDQSKAMVYSRDASFLL